MAVGVTVAARRDRTLERTLNSLAAAGIPRPRLFADGDVELPEGFEVSQRKPEIGGWPNFWLALTELVAREPEADCFMLVQDDAVFCKGTYALLKRLNIPEDCGFLSVYCPTCYNGKLGWQEGPTGYGMASALTVAFPGERAYEFLLHPWAANHRLHSPKSRHFRGDGLHDIDGVIGEWCRQAGLKPYFHSPSLAQHIGYTSVMYPGFTGKKNRRFADSFPGEHVNVDSALQEFSAGLAEWERHGGSRIWALPGHLWAAMRTRLRPSLRTLETGSGLSTKLLIDAGCKHVSLEHSPKWAEKLLRAFPKCKQALTIRDLVGEPPWYDWNPPGEPFDLLLIDGPQGQIGRHGILKVIDRLVHRDSVIFMDDAGRRDEEKLCKDIGGILGWNVVTSTAGHCGYARISRM